MRLCNVIKYHTCSSFRTKAVFCKKKVTVAHFRDSSNGLVNLAWSSESPSSLSTFMIDSTPSFLVLISLSCAESTTFSDRTFSTCSRCNGTFKSQWNNFCVHEPKIESKMAHRTARLLVCIPCSPKLVKPLNQDRSSLRDPKQCQQSIISLFVLSVRFTRGNIDEYAEWKWMILTKVTCLVLQLLVAVLLASATRERKQQCRHVGGTFVGVLGRIPRGMLTSPWLSLGRVLSPHFYDQGELNLALYILYPWIIRLKISLHGGIYSVHCPYVLWSLL